MSYITLNGVNNTDVPLIFMTDIGPGAVAIGHVINVIGGPGVTTDSALNTITINVSGSGFTWKVVTSADNPVPLVSENGYIVKGATPVQFILPASSSVGDAFRIIGYGNLWTIAQNAGQSIRIGIAQSTTGIGGSVSASMVTDCLDIICVTTNLEFFCDVVQGNIIVV
jgi:hypothetical protein